jgi:MerR family transcriptional regulator, light-induced transcriptional regulator
MAGDTEHQLRIGELSRRVGLSPELLRAWERRYGLLRPSRTAGGLRLYSPADEERVRAMNELSAQGLSAAEAARLVLAKESGAAAEPGLEPLEREAERLAMALRDFDADAAHETLDRLFASFTVDTVLTRVVIPYLRELGDLWERGETTVAHEHFASNLLRGRLAALARGWARGAGPRALLACAPGELHDIPLMAFGLALRERGWRITYLGADTPGESLAEAATQLDPALVVVSAVLRSRFQRAAESLTGIARSRAVAIAGRGATAALADSLGCHLLSVDPVAAAEAASELGNVRRPGRRGS